MIEHILGNVEFWKYLSIPVVAAVVGWSTNWVAIKLLFYPIEPIGKPPFFGWQGIIPMKAAKMAAITTDTTLSRLGSLQEVFRAMEPDRIAQHLVKSIEPRVPDYVNWVMLEENPDMWNALPGAIKEIVYEIVRKRLPETLRKMLHDIGENIENMVDLKHIVVTQVLADRNIINRIFLECGDAEFKFIVRSGIYFGFLFGLVQMAVWYFYQEWWILPLFGIIVGYATNWIALRIIFQPLHPKKIGPFVVQGLFLKRQKEVAEVWTGIVTRELITVHNLIHEMLYGPKSEYTQVVLRKHIREIVDSALGLAKPLLQFTLGAKQLAKIEHTATEKAAFITASAFDDRAFTEERARIVQRLLQERMEALSSEEFQYLLRPAFQEDELKLIIMGAVLGFLAGLAQLFFIFGKTLG